MQQYANILYILGPSFLSEGVQTLFFDKAAGRMYTRKIWSGDETSYNSVCDPDMLSIATGVHCLSLSTIALLHSAQEGKPSDLSACLPSFQYVLPLVDWSQVGRRGTV